MKLVVRTMIFVLVAALAVFSISRSSPTRVAEDFHNLWYAAAGQTWSSNKWFGAPTRQNPMDLWIIQEILFEVKPDFFIEAGTYKGGSAVMWASLLSHINPEARVITIDIEDNIDPNARNSPLWRNIDFYLGSSTEDKIVSEIKHRVSGKKVVVLLDSDHREPHVSKELELYSSMVSLGSYLIVQDSNINGHPVADDFGPGPMEALRKFLQNHKEFISDLSRERLMFTFSPNGFLKRIE